MEHNYRESEYFYELFNFGLLHLNLNTALFILVLVLVVMFFLNRLLFRPVLRTLDNRAARLGSQSEAAEKDRLAVSALTTQYETDLVRVRNEVAQVRQESHQKTHAEVARILSEARTAAKADLDAALGELHTQTEAARVELEAATEGLATKISQRLVNA